MKVFAMRVWALIAGYEVIYVRTKDRFSNKHLTRARYAYRHFDPFSEDDAIWVVNLDGYVAELSPDGKVNNGDQWCYVSKSKRLAQKLSWG